MANLIDYIKWRGDLTVSADSFNKLDAALLSQLILLDWTGIIHKNHKPLSIEEIYLAFKHKYPNNPQFGLPVVEKICETLKLMAESKRYKHWHISYYKRIFDEEKCIQFSAFTVHIKQDLSIIVYSGTDDTLCGWLEDLGMIYQEMPSCDLAHQYAIKALNHYDGDFILAGHSKGGALVTHTMLNLDEKWQKKIVKAFCFDSPGTTYDVYNHHSYDNRWKKIVSYIPEMAVIGQLFIHNEKQNVVKSTAGIVLQHDLYTWEVEGKNFVYEYEISQESIYLRYKFRHVIENMSQEDRIFLVESIIKLFAISNCKTVVDISVNRKKIVSALLKLDKSERSIIYKQIVNGFLMDKKVSRILMDLITKKRKFKLKEETNYFPQ